MSLSHTAQTHSISLFNHQQGGAPPSAHGLRGERGIYTFPIPRWHIISLGDECPFWELWVTCLVLGWNAQWQPRAVLELRWQAWFPDGKAAHSSGFPGHVTAEHLHAATLCAVQAQSRYSADMWRARLWDPDGKWVTTSQLLWCLYLRHPSDWSALILICASGVMGLLDEWIVTDREGIWLWCNKTVAVFEQQSWTMNKVVCGNIVWYLLLYRHTWQLSCMFTFHSVCLCHREHISQKLLDWSSLVFSSVLWFHEKQMFQTD